MRARMMPRRRARAPQRSSRRPARGPRTPRAPSNTVHQAQAPRSRPTGPAVSVGAGAKARVERDLLAEVEGRVAEDLQIGVGLEGPAPALVGAGDLGLPHHRAG